VRQAGGQAGAAARAHLLQAAAEPNNFWVGKQAREERLDAVLRAVQRARAAHVQHHHAHALDAFAAPLGVGARAGVGCCSRGQRRRHIRAGG